MLDRAAHAAHLASSCPRVFEPSAGVPDFSGLSATVDIEDVVVPFGLLAGVVEISGDADGGWTITDVKIQLDGEDATYRAYRSCWRHSADRLERVIAEAFAARVTDDMAVDALTAEMGE